MATDRLRKRLQDARRSDGSDAASHPPSSSENFCTFGTPLPLLSSTKRDPNEFKPVWQQEVYDDQGRRRFHGAFTGGWSAGYYNSVGSKEGWTPSSFRSSRKDKAKGQNNEQKNSGQSVEDFMDEEDMMEYRQGRGALKTQEIYNNDKQRTQQEHDPLADLLAGSRAKGAEDISSVHVHSSTLGIQILQHMGWKSGQGLGRLVSAAQRRTLQQLLGLPIDEASDHTTQYLAPPDTPVVALQAEESISRRGLGYDSTDRPATLEEILKRQRRPSSENKEAAEAGFDSDGEEVVYEADHQRRETIKGRSSSNTRWDSNERKAALVGNKVHREKNSRETEHVSELDSKREDVWHDGRRLPPGFCHAEKLSLSQPWFEAPIVPKDWSPDPQRVWSTKSQEESHNVPVKLDADQRAKVLGEARAPGPPPLITNYLNEKDHARLERANAAMPSSDASKASIHTTRSANHAERHLPHLDRQTAQSALRGYIPFGDDVEKQQRYKDYLASQADPEGARSLERQFDQSAEQFWSEVNEFAKSAAIFKPMNSMMATRFESSSTNRTAALTDLQTGQRQAGLYVPVLTRNQDSAGEKDVAERSSTDKHLEQASREDLPSLRRNARMGLFGPQTTRETKSWFPSRLLCKRFNVPYTFTEDNTNDGHGGGRTRGGASEAFDEFGQSLGKANISVPSVNARWEASKRQLQQLAASREWESHDKGRSKDDEEKAREEAEEERSQADAADLSAETDTFTTGIGFGDHTAEGEETSYVKPPADLFRAVFAEDEDQNQTTSTNEQRDEAKLLDDGIQTATPKMADDIASRPIFVPRKRVNEDEQATSTLHSTSSLSLSSKTASRKKAKKQPRSMLSFSMDDDDAQ